MKRIHRLRRIPFGHNQNLTFSSHLIKIHHPNFCGVPSVPTNYNTPLIIEFVRRKLPRICDVIILDRPGLQVPIL
jgi:hypothetical protein